MFGVPYASTKRAIRLWMMSAEELGAEAVKLIQAHTDTDELQHTATKAFHYANKIHLTTHQHHL